MNKTITILLLVFSLIMIPVFILVSIYIITNGSFDGFFDSAIFVGVILTVAAIFPLFMYIPLTKTAKRILPKINSTGYQRTLVGDRFISFLFALVGISGIIFGLLVIETLNLGVEREPLIEIFLLSVGVIIIGHILLFGMSVSGYKVRSMNKSKAIK